MKGTKMVAVSVEYSTVILATANKVWDILTDVEAWPKWQEVDFIKLKTPKPIKEGSMFEVKLAGLKWSITISEAERPIKFSWIGRALGMKGSHKWDFREHEGKTLVITKEIVSGWTVAPLYLVVRKNLQRLDKKWLADLKLRAESS